MVTRTLFKIMAFTALIAASSSQAAIIGSDTAINFTGGSTSFSFGGQTFTLSDNGSNPFNGSPVDIMTQNSGSGTAAVRSFFLGPVPSVDFQDTGIVYSDDFIQYSSFSSPSEIRFSATPSSLGLKVTLGDDAFFGYALFSGTLLQSYAFETIANLGIVSGAPLTNVPSVPEPETYAILLTALGLLSLSMSKRKSVKVGKSSDKILLS